jgi:GGDEF domain-containing protein
VDGKTETIDTETALHNRAYAARSTTEEMYRIHRYKRWMSVALLRMVFHGQNLPEKEDEIFNAYSRFAKTNIRETDTACLVAQRDIYILMPETQLEGARVAVSKLTDFVPHVQEQLKGFDGAAEVLDKTIFFGPSTGDLTFEEIMERLNNALGEPKEAEEA